MRAVRVLDKTVSGLKLRMAIVTFKCEISKIAQLARREMVEKQNKQFEL